ncbi:MAG: hypothetical protein WC282_04855 [Bacilli bacterium]|jgi:hypothetical protein
MKDKLIKFHRKAAYYRFKKVMILFSLLALIALAVSIPLTIQIAAAQAEQEQNNTAEVVDTN